MLYAIQGNHVRWFLSPEENQHLFSLFDLKDAIAEIVITGNWNECLVFKPVIYKSRRSPNSIPGSFTLLALPGPAGSTLQTITTPLDFLKISRLTVATLQQSGNIVCKMSKHTKELLVYPTQLLDANNKPLIAQPVAEEPEKVAQPVVEQAQPVSSPVQEPVVDPMQGDNEGTVSAPLTESETILWAKEVVNEINGILRQNKDIAVYIGERGKSIKFVRRVVTRRSIA